MAQKIVDLDVIAPETLGVRIGGVVYDLPGDIPIPDYIEIERLTTRLDNDRDTEAISALYEKILELFGELNELPEDDEGTPRLPIGPRRLGALVLQLYSGGVEEGTEDRPTKPRGTSKKSTRSRSSK